MIKELKSNQVSLWIETMSPDAKHTINKFIDSLNEDELIEFHTKMWSYNSISDLQANYSQEIRDPFSQRVFLLEPKGLGTGEIWISWLVPGTQLSGGNESFDAELDGRKYEIKAYNFGKHYKTKKKQLASYNGPWRLGNAGAMSNFKFVGHLVYNAEIAHKIAQVKTLDPEILQMQKIISKIEAKSKKYGMVGDFARGEVSGEKMKLMIDFIMLANKHVNKYATEYEIVTFSSSTPGNPDVSYLIHQQTESELSQGTFRIIKQVDLHDLTNPIVLDRTLVRSLYIREGIEVMIDHINSDIANVEQKYDGVDFVVFRKDSMNITPKLERIESRTVEALKAAIGNIFNLSSASVRVREKI